ncbi:MAG: hypothetical protein OEZ22_08815 [Spirochaetia bacterium]|nr:hypothetical protein [Spirochaetia bacterium]
MRYKKIIKYIFIYTLCIFVLLFDNITAVTQQTYRGEGLLCFPSPYVPSEGSLSILFDMTSSGKVTLIIYDNRGNLVKEVLKDVSVNTGSSSQSIIETWDGKNKNGNTVSSGVYTVILEVDYTQDSVKDYKSVFRFVLFR